MFLLGFYRFWTGEGMDQSFLLRLHSGPSILLGAEGSAAFAAGFGCEAEASLYLEAKAIKQHKQGLCGW